MLKVNYFLCADSAALDSRRNTLSAFHIIENMYVPMFPFLMARVCVLASIERSLEEPSLLESTLVATQGETQIFSGPVSLNFAHQILTRAFVEIGGVVVPQPGRLRFALVKDAEELAFYEFTIERLDGPAFEQLPFPARA